MTRDQPGAIAAMAGADERPGTSASKLESGPIAVSKASQENFPVALRLLPRRYRQHLLAVYAYARTVDDTGDLAPPGERPGLLRELADDVRRLYWAGPAGPRLPVVRALAGVVAECSVPMQPLLDLISANEQDQVVARYETFEELTGYCRLSANPIGQLVLHIFGCHTPDRARLSDSICTGLQLAEHWQDVAEDMRSGRVYLPATDMRRFGCTEQDLLAAHASPQLRSLIEFEVGRAAELIDAGAPLIGRVSAAPRAAIAGYVGGGRAALAAIARARYDVLAATPRPGKVSTGARLIFAFARAR